MAEEKQDSKKEISDNQVVLLHNILFSGIQIPARNAKDLVELQEWVVSQVKERKIPTKK